jgi:tetratricopeptide (TPR) repeat protein
MESRVRFSYAYGPAVDQLRRTLELDSNFAVAYLMLGLAYAQQGRLADARAGIQKAVALSDGEPLALAIAALGYVHALCGDRADAMKAVEWLLSLAHNRYVSEYCESMVLTGLGERTKAIAKLESALRERCDRLVYLNVDPVFDSLRSEKRFRNLIHSIGLPSSRH